MAVLITKEPQGEPLNAYNNLIYEFTSTSLPQNTFQEIIKPVFATANFGILNRINVVRAIVRIDNYNIELASLKGKFYINLKPLITTIINKNNFSDKTEIPPSQPFILKDNTLFFEKNIHFKIYLTNGTVEELSITRSFLKSVNQTLWSSYEESDLVRILLPSNDNVKRVTYQEGYPFDISIYSNAKRNVTIKNGKTQISTVFELQKGVNRLFISNGENDNNGFEGVVPLYTGVNKLEITAGSNTLATIFVDKKPVQCGIYLKWFNRASGWSYWLFDKIYIENEDTKELQELNNDFYNLEEKQNGNVSTGKESEREFILSTGQMKEYERALVSELFTSPKVYIYNNTNLQPFTLSDFIQVTIKQGSNELKNASFNKQRFLVRVKQPKQYLQTYAN